MGSVVSAKVLQNLCYTQGASRNGKAPDGSSYIDCAESDEVKALLK